LPFYRPTSHFLKTPAVRLLLLLGLSELIYLAVFSAPFSLSRLFATIPPVDYTKLTGYSLHGLVAFVAGLLLLFGLYSALLKWAATTGLPPWLPYSGLLFALTLFFSYPVLAIDMLIYAVLTRIWGQYGRNPLLGTPDSLPPSDPWAGLAAEWADIASPYGALWETLSLGLFKLAGGDFLSHLFLLKGVAVLAYLGCLILLGRILAQLRPEWRQVGMLAFAWNPLVLLETAQNGHNDILMVFFMLASLWVWLRAGAGEGRLWPALTVMPLLAMAVQVKFIPLLIAPLFILALTLAEKGWARRLGRFIGHSALFSLLVVLPLLPLWPGLDKWAVTGFSSGAGRSLSALLILALRPWLGLNVAFDLSRLLVNAAFLLIGWWAFWQHRDRLSQPRTLCYLSWLLFFWYVLLAMPVFHAWYLLWSLPFAILLLPERRPLLASLVFSLTALLIIPYFETVRAWFPVLLRNHLLGHLVGIPLLLGPPAWLAWRGWGTEEFKADL